MAGNDAVMRCVKERKDEDFVYDGTRLVVGGLVTSLPLPHGIPTVLQPC